MAPSGSAIFGSLLVGIAGVLVSSVATGQTPADPLYPGQAVRLVVPFSAGSVTDLLARIIGEKLGERWGQQLIVENRPGIPGTASVAKSAPDGYTLMLTSNGHTVAAVLNKNLPFDPVREFSGVTQVASVPLVLIVPPDLPATTLRELVALAKDRPGALNFASSGLASTAYISGELFKQTAKIDIVHVPYKGAPESLTGIMRADSHMFFAGINIALDLIQSGKVRPSASQRCRPFRPSPRRVCRSSNTMPGSASWRRPTRPSPSAPRSARMSRRSCGRPRCRSGWKARGW
jgi:tripartite-type tricarboxylate transporter receptor subunit TctC